MNDLDKIEQLSNQANLCKLTYLEQEILDKTRRRVTALKATYIYLSALKKSVKLQNIITLTNQALLDSMGERRFNEFREEVKKHGQG